MLKLKIGKISYTMSVIRNEKRVIGITTFVSTQRQRLDNAVEATLAPPGPVHVVAPAQTAAPDSLTDSDEIQAIKRFIQRLSTPPQMPENELRMYMRVMDRALATHRKSIQYQRNALEKKIAALQSQILDNAQELSDLVRSMYALDALERQRLDNKNRTLERKAEEQLDKLQAKPKETDAQDVVSPLGQFIPPPPPR